MLRSRALALLAFIVALAPPSSAHAGEGERVLSFGLDLSHWSVPEVTENPEDDDRLGATGGALASDFEYGWNDTLWLRASGHLGLYSSEIGTAYAAGATVGLTYALDVLRYVPLLQAGVGALVVAGDGLDTKIEPVVELGLGLAVLESRRFSWGFVARFDGLASSARFFTIGPRLSFRWGYF